MTTVTLRSIREWSEKEGWAGPDDRQFHGSSESREIDARRWVILPCLSDVGAVVASAADLQAASRGGFGTVVASPESAALGEQVPGLHLGRLAPLTSGLQGVELADLFTGLASGACGLGNGRVPLRDAEVIRNTFRYVRDRAPVVIRPTDPRLERGVVKEGVLSSTLGLPATPAEAEWLGIQYVLPWVRRYHVAVHFTHVWTAEGVALLRDAQAEGLPVSGSVAVSSVVFDPLELLSSSYDTRYRSIAPLGEATDRDALRQGVEDGTLTWMTDHQPPNPESSNREFEASSPGLSWFGFAFATTVAAMGGDVVKAARGWTGARGRFPGTSCVDSRFIWSSDGTTVVMTPRGAWREVPGRVVGRIREGQLELF